MLLIEHIDKLVERQLHDWQLVHDKFIYVLNQQHPQQFSFLFIAMRAMSSQVRMRSL